MGRNVFATGRFCRLFKLRVADNSYRAQQLERARYWLSTREAMAHGTTWASSVDATRFSGKDWQAGPLCNVDTQKYAWMAPVVGD